MLGPIVFSDKVRAIPATHKSLLLYNGQGMRIYGLAGQSEYIALEKLHSVSLPVVVVTIRKSVITVMHVWHEHTLPLVNLSFISYFEKNRLLHVTIVLSYAICQYT